MVNPQPSFIQDKYASQLQYRRCDSMLVPIVYRNVMPGLYMISDQAEIFIKSQEGLIDITHRASKGKSDGYWGIQLITNKGESKRYPLYRLVIGSFQGDRSDMVVDHVDMNKDHNYLSNLEYVTYDENLRRAAKACGKPYRELFDEATVRKICELLEKGYNSRKIQRELGLEMGPAMDDSIMRIISRKSWKNISKDYTWDLDDVRLKMYSKENLRAIAYLVVHSGLEPKEIAQRFPKYNYKQLHQVVKKMNQGRLYKKFLNEAGSTTILEGPKDEDGFTLMVPTELGAKRLRKIRQSR